MVQSEKIEKHQQPVLADDLNLFIKDAVFSELPSLAVRLI